jgi:hypothetical protein
LKLAAITAVAVFILVLGVVIASDLTSPTGSAPIGTTLFIGVVGGVIWAIFFFILAYCSHSRGYGAAASVAAVASARPLAHRLTTMDVSGIAIAAALLGVIATITYIVLGVFAVRYLRRIADKR